MKHVHIALLTLVACASSSTREFETGGAPSDPAPPASFEPTSACPDGAKTTVSGTVFTPSGDLPLYDAIVFSPSAPLAPIASGASCEGRCGVPVSGAPRAAALSASNGSFRVEVPPGKNVPLVVQIGKWRRQTILPEVIACEDNVLTDRELTRLPRSSKEGDLPRMAIETGEYDALECLLLRLGIEPSEFGAPGSAARVHLYRAGAGATLEGAAPVDGKQLWSELATLKTYDAVFFECAGPDYPTQMNDVERANVARYANEGGRVFTTDYAGLAWIKGGAAPFPETATWKAGASRSSFVSQIDRTFPKGQAFGEWLYATHAITQPTAGITITSGTTIVPQVASVVPPSQRWLYASTGGAPLQYSFVTPVGAGPDAACGRVAFNDFHVSDTSGDYAGARSFPSGCRAGALTPQELALAFLVLDLAACVSDDSKDPPQPH